MKNDWQSQSLFAADISNFGCWILRLGSLNRLRQRISPAMRSWRARCSLCGGQKRGHGRSGCQPLVKVEPESESWWINLAYSVRRIEDVEKAEAILLRAETLHPEVAMITFNLACYASVTSRLKKLNLACASKGLPALGARRRRSEAVMGFDRGLGAARPGFGCLPTSTPIH